MKRKYRRQALYFFFLKKDCMYTLRISLDIRYVHQEFLQYLGIFSVTVLNNKAGYNMSYMYGKCVENLGEFTC